MASSTLSVNNKREDTVPFAEQVVSAVSPSVTTPADPLYLYDDVDFDTRLGYFVFKRLLPGGVPEESVNPPDTYQNADAPSTPATNGDGLPVHDVYEQCYACRMSEDPASIQVPHARLQREGAYIQPVRLVRQGAYIQPARLERQDAFIE
ncbi:hypothetical protein BGX28_001122 [Mortierella sp. GBA30]|nr:hypothetical protein BGX28_001122 [Mortierella sp. GBA30]